MNSTVETMLAIAVAAPGGALIGVLLADPEPAWRRIQDAVERVVFAPAARAWRLRPWA